MSSEALTTIDLAGLKKVAQGKVRDVFALDETTLLFVASDRVSAFDVVMRNGIPNKGAMLTLLSAHWFAVLSARIPGLKTHFLSLDLPAGVSLTETERAAVRHRAMQVRRLKVFPVEAIVRGYLTGSAWNEYQRSGTVHDIQVPPGMQQCQAFATPLYTPSTKAEAGQHDENIHPDEAAKLVGAKYAPRIEALALQIYTVAAEYAKERGVLIADTKFEFALDEATDEVVLVDEVLTPDSSRFWPADRYALGRDQESFDKQFIRNWLIREKLKGKPGVELPEDICKATETRYREVFKLLTGKSFDEVAQEA